MIPPHTQRLAKKVNQPGGMTENEAVVAATANLETLRGRTQLELDAMVRQLLQLGQALRTPPAPAALTEMYALSNAVVGIAGVFGMTGLSAVAYSLCELIDRLRTAGSWNAPVMHVHLDSLKLMHGTAPSQQEALQIQQALQKLMERVPA